MWYVTLVVIIWAALILWPIAVIASLNTLFGLGIAYGFWQWLSVVVLTITLRCVSALKS